jgi:hypothetical protein
MFTLTHLTSLHQKLAAVLVVTSSLAVSHTMETRLNCKLNGVIHITCAILKLVAASTAEAELGALFLNAQEATVLGLILAELDHPHPPTPIHIDNTATVGNVNSTIKHERSRAMEMR